MNLRVYQQELVNACETMLSRGNRSVLIQSPTGSGKTLLATYLIKKAVADSTVTCWFIVHRRELIEQTRAALRKAGVSYGVIAADFKEDSDKRVQIASIQTLTRRKSNQISPQLIIWDECHHIPAKSWSDLYGNYPEAFHIGLTATPERLDGKGLKEWFNCMVNGPSVNWLISEGHLSKYRLFAPLTTVNVKRVPTRMGDYALDALEKVVDKREITGNAIDEYKSKALGKRALVFCVSVEHSKRVAEEFTRAGIKAIHLDGETEHKERDRLVEEFKQGDIKVLCNVDLFGEGYDLPCLDVAILLRPTQSRMVYLQQVGRAMRVADGKSHAIILDHVGNWKRHGLPDDDRDWSLDGREACHIEDAGSRIRICPSCHAAQRYGSQQCNYCGYVFESRPRVIPERDGELVEISRGAHMIPEKSAEAKTVEKGSEVVHPVFGRGTVTAVIGTGDSTKIEVSFHKYGLKRLVEKLAKLKSGEDMDPIEESTHNVVAPTTTPPTTPQSRLKKPKYEIGCKVFHEKFGRGHVLDAKERDTGFCLRIHFTNGSEKAIMDFTSCLKRVD